jgi:hypothetical protein
MPRPVGQRLNLGGHDDGLHDRRNDFRSAWTRRADIDLRKGCHMNDA